MNPYLASAPNQGTAPSHALFNAPRERASVDHPNVAAPSASAWTISVRSGPSADHWYQLIVDGLTNDLAGPRSYRDALVANVWRVVIESTGCPRTPPLDD